MTHFNRISEFIQYFCFSLPNVTGRKRHGEKVHMAVLFENNVSFFKYKYVYIYFIISLPACNYIKCIKTFD